MYTKMKTGGSDMQKDLLELALNEVKELRPGEVFLVKDLFKGYEWNRLSVNERRNLGRKFYDPFLNPYLKSHEIEILEKKQIKSTSL